MNKIPVSQFLKLSFISGALLMCSRSARATDVYLGLQAYTQGGKGLGVGLAPFTAASMDSNSTTVANELRSVIREDLLFIHLFQISEGGPAPAGPKLESLPWSGMGAQVVVGAEIKSVSPQVSVVCGIYDVSSGKLLWSKEGSGSHQTLRRLAHLMSDQLVFQLSGQAGIAHSHIAFVNNRTRHKEIYTMDYDGAGVHRVTSLGSITILPKWSPDGKSIVFNSFHARNPDAFVVDANGGNLRGLSTRQGLNTAPNWAPDGNSLALTLSRGGDPDLYLVDHTGRIMRRLTYVPGVDTSPSFSPNGQQIAFVSDRSGNPELYVMDTTGANVQRLTYGQWVDAPSWSPRGDAIAYERQRGHGYDIYLIDPSGRNNRTITQDQGRNENPSWSPDGRFLAFSSDRDGRRRIYVMGADGSDPHPVGDSPGESSTPSWGP
jgi:TolB protein